MGTRLTLLRPGVVPYGDALAMQRRIAADVASGGDEALVLLEHPSTYTLGARGNRLHLLTPVELLRSRGADVVRSDRGGDITFHGPGQIVGYPIVDIRARGIGAADYVRRLERTLTDALASFGIEGACWPGRPGVWVNGAKVAAIGVRVSRGITTHGFALNVNTDLSWFHAIVPCGIADAGVTSMQGLLGRDVALPEVEEALARSFERVFDVGLVEHDAVDAGAAQPRPYGVAPADVIEEATEVAVGR